MSTSWTGAALLIVYGGVLLAGLILIGLALLSLLRSFTAGSRSLPAASNERALARATIYALGLGAVVMGLVGLIARLLLRVEPGVTVLWALGVGLAVALAAQVVLVFLPNRGRVQEAATAIDAAGQEARVVVTVPANGLGEVAYGDGDNTINMGARSATGRPISRGERVVIDRVAQRVAIVRPAAGGKTGQGGRPA